MIDVFIEERKATHVVTTQPADVDELYKIAAGGKPIDLTMVSNIWKFSQKSDQTQLDPNTIDLAKKYIQTIGLDPDNEPELVKSFGIMRERRYPVPPGLEENAHIVNRLSDQNIFAFALLLCGKREQFNEFIPRYPHLFGLKSNLT